MTPHWCIPPIRWVQRYFVPPKDSADWTRVSYQPMLYLAVFAASIIILIWGDFTNLPSVGGLDQDRNYGLFWVWGGLSTLCPVMALGSLYLIQNRTGAMRYRGLVMRLGADVGQFTAMALYFVLRIVWGDYHVYPVAVLGSAVLFVFHLCMRDWNRLRQVEKLATQIRRDADG